MAISLNKVFLIGNLTRDPELRYIPSGTAVAGFDLAINRPYLTQSGEKKEETSFIKIVVWARRAEVCAEYLKKGSPVFVEGRMRSRSWEGKDGQKRSTVEVIASNVQFLRSSPRVNAAPQQPDKSFDEGNKGEGVESIDLDSAGAGNNSEEIPF